MEKPAILGGPKAKKTPYGSGNRYGEEEMKELREALEQGSLFYAHGEKVNELCRRFAKMYGKKHCVATSSGTAAIHVALAAAGVGPGDEVITGPITDMGTLVGILYQNAIPLFADVDPHTYNMLPSSIEERITERTRAILLVHLAGNPCEMDAIVKLARSTGVTLIEDCAQSYLSLYRGRPVGTFGEMGCFSLNEFKHISCGDGGMVVTDDDELARKFALYADKCYDRTPGAPRNPAFLAPNYRMTELQGAVALAQLEKLEGICEKRNGLGDMLSSLIERVPAVHPHKVLPGDRCTYWFYMFRTEPERLGVEAETFASGLRAEGVRAAVGYIDRPVYLWTVLKERAAYARTNCPWECPAYAGAVEYEEGLCPNAEAVLRTGVRVPINEFHTETDIEETALAIHKVASHYAEERERP